MNLKYIKNITNHQGINFRVWGNEYSIKFYSIVTIFQIYTYLRYKKFIYGNINISFCHFISVYLISECIKLFFKFIIPFSVNDFYLITISIIMSLLNIIYIRTVYIFRKELKNCSREELDSLREGWSPRHVKFVFV